MCDIVGSGADTVAEIASVPGADKVAEIPSFAGQIQ
jgi:hypothetical protein